MFLQNIKHKKIVLAALFMAAILIQFLANRYTASAINGMVEVAGQKLPVNSVNGTLQVAMGILCILLVMVDYKYGFTLAVIMILISLVGCLRGLFIKQNLGVIPGVFNNFIQLASIWIISGQFSISNYKRITDKVTGLQNRYGFEEYLEKKLANKARGSLLYIHLEGVTDVNTKYGRAYGDELLRIVASRISTIVGSKGRAFRLGGPEFAVLMYSDLDSMTVSEAIIESVESRTVITVDGTERTCYINASIGVSSNIDKKLSGAEAMKNADVAMTFAFRNQKQKICIYNEDIKKQVERRSEIEKLIKESLEKNYFYLDYQPQFTSRDKKLRGFECLLRMKLPDGQLVSPGEFIPIAEASSLIIDVDRYVLKRAMTEFRDICEKSQYNLTLSINVSAKGIAQPDLVGRLLKTVNEINFPISCLELEITEYSVADSSEKTINNIKRLRDLGMKIALDDFGTGYTSMAQLMKTPVDLLKIDKSLIDCISKDERHKDFVDTVLYLGRIMNCAVIAEGVESDSQLQILKELNCDFIQGFVWGRPLAYATAIELAEDNI